jgi:hypothetical protein
VLVWKVSKDAPKFVVLLSLLVCSEILYLVYWIFLLKISKTEAQINVLNILSGASHLLMFLVFLALGVDWIFALPFVLGRKTFTAIVERIIYATFVGYAVVLLILSIILNILAVRLMSIGLLVTREGN